jgi:peptidoglycan lytic transglycosylase G
MGDEGAVATGEPVPEDQSTSRRDLPAARARARRGRRLRVLLVVVGVVVLGGIVWAVVWYEHAANPGRPGPATVVSVRSGATGGTVASELGRRGVVSSTLALRVYFALHGTPLIRPGEYLLHRPQSFASLSRALAGGPDVFATTVLPGLTVSEVATRVGEVPGHDGAAFSTVATSGAVSSPFAPPGVTSLEGLLGTGSYTILPRESDSALLTRMVQRFDQSAVRVGLVSGSAALGFTPYQVVTVASIVQKEGVYPQNMAKVARVVYNRLASRMALQMDSTVLYAEHRDGGPVGAADLALDTPYNTYRHSGLTPTPICFPSEAALSAALHPAPGSWLYFVVVQPDGTEAFANTYAEQLANEHLAASRGLG